MAGQIRVLHRVRRQVHREVQVPPARVRGVQGADRLGEHPPVDVADQAVALGVVQEGPGSDQLVVVVAQPQEQLVMLAPGRRRPERDDGLGVQHEALVLDRAAQPRHPVAVSRQLVPALTGALVDRDAVPAGELGVVHRDIGLDQQRLAVLEPPGLQDRQPGRCRHLRVPPARHDVPVLPDRVDQRGRDRLRALEIGVGEDRRELVTADARQDVVRAQGRAQRVTDAHDQLVARRMAEGVVDVLEAVEVEHHQRRLPPLQAEALELLLEAPTVDQAGARVVVGQVLQTLLEALALGDVHGLDDDQGLAVGAVRRRR